MGDPSLVAEFREGEEEESDGAQVRPLFATCCTTASCIALFAKPASRRAKPPSHLSVECVLASTVACAAVGDRRCNRLPKTAVSIAITAANTA